MPVLMWASFLLIGATTPGYDLFTRPASDLGARGFASGWLFNLGFFYIPGLLSLMFALALADLARPASLMAALLVISGGVSLILSGVFRVDPASISATRLHQAVGISFLTAMPLAPIMVAVSATGRARLRRYAVLSLAIGAALTLVALLSVALPEKLRPSSGVFQRCSAVLETAWFWLTAFALLRQSKISRSRRSRIQTTRPEHAYRLAVARPSPAPLGPGRKGPLILPLLSGRAQDS